MEELDECTGGGTGALEGKLIRGGRALQEGVDVIMDDNAFQDS